ncbi:MAG: hypothetical protein LUO93_07880 [Methanomicrobiales archaeon]|nr:hypothetical protein [Methanomicrobiales archaeon]
MPEVNLFESIKKHVCKCAFNLALTSNGEVLLKMPMREYHVSEMCIQKPVRMAFPFRKAAYTIAVARVVEAMRLRGWV